MNINELLLFHFSRNIDSSLVDYSVLCLQSTIIRIILHLTIQLFYKHLILLQASVLQQIIVFIQGQVSGSQAPLQSQGTTFSGNNDYSITVDMYSTVLAQILLKNGADLIIYIIQVWFLASATLRSEDLGQVAGQKAGQQVRSPRAPCSDFIGYRTIGIL